MTNHIDKEATLYHAKLGKEGIFIDKHSKIGYHTFQGIHALVNGYYESYKIRSGLPAVISENVHIASDVIIYEGAYIGPRTKIFHYSVIRENASVGEDCIISKGAYLDRDVLIGSRVKLENNVNVYLGVTLEDDIFVGPNATFTNDHHPRSTNLEGKLKQSSDWKLSKTLVKRGASIGAGATILPNLTIGEHAMVGAGSLVTKDVPSHALVYGLPAKFIGYVCFCGTKVLDSGCKTCDFTPLSL